MHKLRYRQIHLDFHTSEAIKGIGSKFDTKQFQQALQIGHVNSITCFAKCHHGWSYYDSKISPMHPHLTFDLLRSQFESCKEIDVNVPIYISAGFDEYAARSHPEWVYYAIDNEERATRSPLNAQWKRLCFNSPYVDYLCSQIQEVVMLFPNCDGIFLDIINQFDCGCKYCISWMEENGLDATNPSDRKKCIDQALVNYYEKTTHAIRSISPGMPIFHNSGHIQRGKKDILKYLSHLELESLPTGGWGYDHFPLSAKYCINLPFEKLGMTGKFHTTWGEFGGYKHPNALMYECASMIAYGTKCSVGDQLHPLGSMDMTTYRSIGQAYEYVQKCESFCDDVENIAEIAILSAQSTLKGDRHVGSDPDIGAARILLESHFLFEVVDQEMDFSKYGLLVLPDVLNISPELKLKLDQYLENGGKLLMTGQSGIDLDSGKPVFDIGAELYGKNEYCPDYLMPIKDVSPEFVTDPMVMYMSSQKMKVTDGESLGKIYNPYFNRAYNHFCGHRHAPYDPGSGDYDCGVINGNICYLAHPLFSLYRGVGSVVCKDYVVNIIKILLGESKIRTNLPSTARITMMHQLAEKRYLVHLLYANTINRGGPMKLESGTVSGESRSVEVIEDLVPLHDTEIKIITNKKINRVVLQPQGVELEFHPTVNGIEFCIDKFSCHQIVELDYQ